MCMFLCNAISAVDYSMTGVEGTKKGRKAGEGKR